MTHTLHRQTAMDVDADDYVILSMAAQRFNDKGAAEKLKRIFKLVAEASPDNLADDNRGGRFTGCTDAEILEQMQDRAYVGAVFSDRSRLKAALQKIKEADLGMSVVVSGNYGMVFQTLEEIGVRPHTVNMSLGVFGNKRVLPRAEILAISTMCGHGMVTKCCIEDAIEKVRSGALTPEEGSESLASTCTCGVFNPKRAAELLKKIE